MSKRISIYEEDIVIKPSTELIPDEYEHKLNKNVSFHIFTLPEIKNNLEQICETFKSIGYNVNDDKIHSVDSKIQFEKELEKVRDGSGNGDALFIIFNYYFKENGTINLKNEEYSLINIWTQFTTKNCPGLKNKPKVFVFQLAPYPTHILTDSSVLSTKYELTYDTPSEADMLIIYHTDYNCEDVFLNNLCDNIDQYGKTEDLITLASVTDITPRPLIVSTLTRKFYTTVSADRGHHLVINENTDELLQILEGLDSRLAVLEDTKKKTKKGSFLKSFSLSKESKHKIKPLQELDKKQIVQIKKDNLEKNNTLEKKKNWEKPPMRSRTTSLTTADDFSKKNSLRKTNEKEKKKPWRF